MPVIDRVQANGRSKTGRPKLDLRGKRFGLGFLLAPIPRLVEALHDLRVPLRHRLLTWLWRPAFLVREAASTRTSCCPIRCPQAVQGTRRSVLRRAKPPQVLG